LYWYKDTKIYGRKQMDEYRNGCIAATNTKFNFACKLQR
jgi:hypothetical protein